MPLRVGESFVADANRFAQAALYATDNGADVIQEALGTLNAPRFARQAIEYAYHHGVTVIASAADEAAEHHNEPGSLPDTIVVNSVTKYDSTLTSSQPSYLQLNGCTNFGTADHAVGAEQLVLVGGDRQERRRRRPDLQRGRGRACTPSGLLRSTDCRRVDGVAVRDHRQRGPPADGLRRRRSPARRPTTAAARPMTSTSPRSPSRRARRRGRPRAPTRTARSRFAADQNGGVDRAAAPHARATRRARAIDEFYGYGRLNADKAVSRGLQRHDPARGRDHVARLVRRRSTRRWPRFRCRDTSNARVPYRCEVDVAPGGEPNNAGRLPPGRARAGATARPFTRSRFSGVLANDQHRQAARRCSRRQGFTGNANGGRRRTPMGARTRCPTRSPSASSSRTAGGTADERRGSPPAVPAPRRPDCCRGFPIELRGDGDLVAAAGRPRRRQPQRAGRRDLGRLGPRVSPATGASCRAGRSTPPRSRCTWASAPTVRAVSAPATTPRCWERSRPATCSATGGIEVVADDNQGNVYAWDQQGHLVFHQHSNPRFSGAPLTPFHTVRQRRPRSHRARVPGRAGARRPRRPRDWTSSPRARTATSTPGTPTGDPVAGFPVLVADPDKVAAVDPDHRARDVQERRRQPRARRGPGQDHRHAGGGATSTARRPPRRSSSGATRSTRSNSGDEGPINISPTNSLLTSLARPSGAAQLGQRARLCDQAQRHAHAVNPFLPGWPVKIGIIDAGLLPDVGEGINGSPVVGPDPLPLGRSAG